MNTTIRNALFAVAAVGALSLTACKTSGDSMDAPKSDMPATEQSAPASDTSTMPTDTTTTPPADATTTPPADPAPASTP